MSWFSSASRAAGRTVRFIVDAVLPPLCLACDTPLSNQGLLCASCWSRLDFIAPPACALCGLPFAFDAGPEALCGACALKRPAFDRSRAVFRYDDRSKGLVLGFKHADRTEAAGVMGRWLARVGAEFKGDVLIAPVPLHPKRLFERRYNQSALLASALRESWNEGRLLPDLLLRRRHTPSQGHLSPTQRRRNLAGAFTVNPRYQEVLKGRRVVLVDDVMTTGATVEQASKTLKRAGAGAVDVLVLARALKD